MKAHILSTLGAAVGGVVASICCIGPIVLAGAGTAGLFAGFWEYRPYVIPAALILLGLAFYFAYRKREVECEDGTCKIERTGKWNKFGVWVVAVVVAFMIAFPYLGLGPAAAFDETVNPTTEVVVEIEGLYCVSCAANIERSVSGVNGIREVEVKYPEGKGIFRFDEQIISINELIEKINNTGFTVSSSEVRGIKESH